jgi:branched-chain amino acid transport system substrate-binding protein
MSTHRSSRALVAVGALCLALSACGTRASEEQVLRGVGGGTVSLTPDQVAKLGVQAPGSVSAPTTTTGGAAPTTTGGSSGMQKAASVKGGSTGAVIAPGTTIGTAPRSGGQTGTAKTCAKQGAPVVVGQVGSFSGVLGPINGGAKTGLQIWAKAINAQGGVACHHVSVFSADDGADPSKTQASVQDLVQNKHAVAILGSFVQLSYAGLKSGIESQNVPAVGGDLSDPNWNASRMAFPQGANIRAQIIGAYKQANEQGHKKIALLYCVESSICSNAKKVTIDEGGAAKAGSTVVYSAQVSLTQSDFTAQCQNAKNAGADMIAAGVDGSAIIRIARSCSALSYHPVFTTAASAVGASQAQDPGLEANTLGIASSVAPWSNSDNAAEAAYQTAMKTYAGGTATDGPSAIAWASGQLFAAAISKLGDAAMNSPITSAMVLKGLGLIKNETLGGLIPPLSFSPGQASAPEGRCVYYVLLTKDGWSGPRKSTPVCV